MQRTPQLLTLRYLLAGAAALAVILSPEEHRLSGLMAFLLLLILSQYRLFMALGPLVQRLLFLFQCVLFFFVCRSLGGGVYPLSGLMMMDGVLFFDGKERFLAPLCAALALGGGLWSRRDPLWGLNFIFMVLCYTVFYYLSLEDHKKYEAQSLYDQLRLSEAKREEAYRDLERYAKSVEEITVLRERNRISREIHDSAGHALTTILIQLGALLRLLGKDSVPGAMVADLEEFSRESLDRVRRSVSQLKPQEYKELDGLVLIENLINRFRTLTKRNVTFSFSKERWSLNEDQSSVLYRVVQEFLSNSVRHGEAQNIKCHLLYDADWVTLTLKDDGLGTERIVWGLGLKGMKERLEELGGSLSVASAPKKGFSVRGSLPRVPKFILSPKGGPAHE